MKEGTPPNMINLAEESRSSESIENVGLDDDRYGHHCCYILCSYNYN